ncbi:MAG TPA: Holliday junction resolvase RuvX, partial [Candidatus Saccharibacteria bacterium]|nr:Holliday junction resolvase RuvX [Candidatus Saccharibacteria bacterium]
MSSRTIIGLDVGTKRIGVAVADPSVGIAVPFITIDVDGNELQAIAEIIVSEGADTIVVGYPRNQSGEKTAQTAEVEFFAENLKDMVPHIVFQDESLTSVLAEQHLKAHNRPYTKS